MGLWKDLESWMWELDLSEGLPSLLYRISPWQLRSLSPSEAPLRANEGYQRHRKDKRNLRDWRLQRDFCFPITRILRRSSRWQVPSPVFSVEASWSRLPNAAAACTEMSPMHHHIWALNASHPLHLSISERTSETYMHLQVNLSKSMKESWGTDHTARKRVTAFGRELPQSDSPTRSCQPNPMRDLFAAPELEKQDTKFNTKIHVCEKENIENSHSPVCCVKVTDFSNFGMTLFHKTACAP